MRLTNRKKLIRLLDGDMSLDGLEDLQNVDSKRTLLRLTTNDARLGFENLQFTFL
jgi:hypothetical protein